MAYMIRGWRVPKWLAAGGELQETEASRPKQLRQDKRYQGCSPCPRLEGHWCWSVFKDWRLGSLTSVGDHRWWQQQRRHLLKTRRALGVCRRPFFCLVFTGPHPLDGAAQFQVGLPTQFTDPLGDGFWKHFTITPRSGHCQFSRHLSTQSTNTNHHSYIYI